jgi:hypothetical protein
VNEEWKKSPEEIAAVLDRWRHSKAQAWAYTCGHGVFILRLFPAEPISSRTAYIQCRDCQVIQLYQTDWENADITISSAPHRLGVVYTITDPGRLQIVCWSVFVTESDKMINFHRDWSNLD